MVFQNNSQKAFLSHNVSETPVGCVPVGNGGTGRWGKGHVWGVRQPSGRCSLAGSEDERTGCGQEVKVGGVFQQRKSKDRGPGVRVEDGVSRKLRRVWLTREDVRGMGEAQRRQDRQGRIRKPPNARLQSAVFYGMLLSNTACSHSLQRHLSPW